MSGAFGTNWLDLSSTANRYVQTYYRGFVDISGGPLYIRNNSLYLNSGDISLNGRLYGAGDVSFNSRLFVGQDTSLNGNLFVNSRTIQNGDISANSRLFVGSDVSMGGKLFTIGDTSHNARLFVGSDVSFNARLFVAGDLSLNGNVSINGNLIVPTQTSTDNSTKVATTAFVKTALSSVTGASAGFTGDVSVNYRLYVGADASLQGRLYVNNDASLNQRLYVGSDVSFGNRLYVAGDVSMGGSLGLAGGNFYVNNSKTLIVNPSAFGSATGTSSSNTFTMFHTGQAMAVSYTGQYLLLSDPQGYGQGVVLSTNYGTTVTQITGQSFSSIVVYSVAMSSDGSKMAVATGSALYYSTNYGSTWTAGATTSIGFLSATNDFSRLYGYGSGGVYLSTNNGSSFTLQSNTVTYGVSGSANASNNCKFQMNSATGQYGIAYYNTSAYYTSNYGVTWTQATGLPTLMNNGGFVGMSSTGQYAFVDNTNGGNASSTSLFYSTNYGASFSQSTITGGTATGSHYSTTISSSGRYGICGNYVTTNYGANWSLSTAINSLFTSTGGFTLGAIISGNELYNFHTMYGTKYVYYQQNATTNLFSQSLLITNDISTNSRLFITNDVSMSSNLYVGLTTINVGDISANSRLFVGSDVSFGGKLFTVGDASLNGNVSIANDLTINGNMYVKAYTTKQMITELSYQLIIAEDISVNGRLFLSNDASINNRLFVGSDVSMGGKLFTVGDTSHNAKLFVGSDVSFGARLFVAGDLSLNGNLNINGNMTVPTQTSTDNSTKVATTAFVKTAVGSVSTTYFSTDVSMAAKFFVSNDVSFGARLFLSSDASINSRLYVGGDVSMQGKLFSVGDVSHNSRLYVGSDASFGGKLFVAGDVSLNGNVSAITQTSTDNSSKVATTAFVKTAMGSAGASSYFSTDVSMASRLFVSGDASFGGNVIITKQQTTTPSSNAANANSWYNQGITWAASGSSYLSGTGYYSWCNFSLDTTGNTYWISNNIASTSYVNGTGAYSGTTSTAVTGQSNILGEWLEISGNAPLRLATFSLQTSSSGIVNYSGRFPKSFWIVGTSSGSPTSWDPILYCNFTSNTPWSSTGSGNFYATPATTLTAGTQSVSTTTTYGYQSNYYSRTRFIFTALMPTCDGVLAFTKLLLNFNTSQINNMSFSLDNINNNQIDLSGSFVISNNFGVGMLYPKYPIDMSGVINIQGQVVGGVGLPDNSHLISTALPLDICGNNFANTWTLNGSAPSSSNWSAISVSANGQYQSAVVYGGYIYTSANYGNTWTQRSVSANWSGVAISSSGQYQTAVGAGNIYISSDYGITWTLSTALTSVCKVAMSATGQNQTAVVTNGYIYISTNYGATWTVNSSTGTQSFMAISLSATGQYQNALAQYANYLSSDYGNTWTLLNGINGQIQCTAVSASGKYQTAVVFGSNVGYIWTSSNYGATWTQRTSQSVLWYYVTMSSSGQLQVAAMYNTMSGVTQGIYYSVDYGVTWFQSTAPALTWGCVAMSANGQYISAGVYGGAIYTSTSPSATLAASNTLFLGGDASMNRRLFVGSDASFGGKLYVASTLTKGGGSFDIAHPDPSKPPGSRLRHCFVESPTRGDNIYRFKTTTTDLSASIVLPSYYKFLNEDTQIWVNAVNCLGSGYGVLQSDNETVRVTVSQDGDYNVLIIGTRKDQMMIDFFDNAGGVEYLIN
jgi:predicted acyltransferase (DUF342 family)